MGFEDEVEQSLRRSSFPTSEFPRSPQAHLGDGLVVSLGLLGDRGLGHLWPSTTQQLKDALLEAAERLG